PQQHEEGGRLDLDKLLVLILHRQVRKVAQVMDSRAIDLPGTFLALVAVLRNRSHEGGLDVAVLVTPIGTGELAGGVDDDARIGGTRTTCVPREDPLTSRTDHAGLRGREEAERHEGSAFPRLEPDRFAREYRQERAD